LGFGGGHTGKYSLFLFILITIHMSGVMRVSRVRGRSHGKFFGEAPRFDVFPVKFTPGKVHTFFTFYLDNNPHEWSQEGFRG